jgi:hypothetical protein
MEVDFSLSNTFSGGNFLLSNSNIHAKEPAKTTGTWSILGPCISQDTWITPSMCDEGLKKPNQY